MTVGQLLIAGGGLGGLAAACCLLEAGFDVEVYEQSAALGETGAGLQLSANAGRVLAYLGLGEAVDEVAAHPDAYRFRLFDSGEVLQSIPLGDSYRRRHGVPYSAIHRADLHGLLVDRLRRLKPDAIHLGARARGFRESADGVELLFEDGAPARGDLLIGADGIHSTIRAQIVGRAPADYTGDAAWRVMVEADRLPASLRPATVDIWVGPGRHAVVYPVRGGQLVNFVGLVEHRSWEVESWTAQRPWAELKADFEGWHATIQGLIDAAEPDQCYRWALNQRAPIGNWNTARATLLGDAAHPSLPYMAQGAAMALEDAAVIARALRREAEPAAALALYQRNRLGRTARVVEESAANGKLFHLPTVAALRQAFSRRDMNAERSAWLFSYDPLSVELA